MTPFCHLATLLTTQQPSRRHAAVAAQGMMGRWSACRDDSLHRSRRVGTWRHFPAVGRLFYSNFSTDFLL